QRCCICRLRGASVTCWGWYCPQNFYFPCSSKQCCISQFFAGLSPLSHRSFCWKHQLVQQVRAVQRDQTPCLICQEAVAGQPCCDTLVCPTCASTCIQGQALRSALHHFCRDMLTFQVEMCHLGIKTPER
ncbi:G2E3 ligase, partial [Pelecanoides urinatrix]|nr:G2E3 ligase [Pelecanoides urinatrix]